MDYNLWLNEAKQYINENLQVDDIFTVSSLFNGNQWQKLTKGERISFGRYFSSLVKDGNLKNIKKIERKSNNHSQYIKVKE